MSQAPDAVPSTNSVESAESVSTLGATEDRRIGWYFESGGARKGPIDFAEIQLRYQNGTIPPEGRVWHRSFGQEWKKAVDASLSKDHDDPPPLPSELVGNGFAWFLAAVPLLGAFVEKIASDQGLIVPTFAATIGYILVNYTISSLDSKKIKAAGRNPDGINISIWGTIIVPVYFYKRSVLLSHTPGYLFAWIAAFFLSLLIADPQIFSGRTYFGLGIPPCESSASKGMVTSIFADLPIMKPVGIKGLSVDNIKEVAKDGSRSRACEAEIVASNQITYRVRYEITEKEKQFWYSLNLVR